MKIGVAQIRLSNQIRKNLDKIARFSKKASKRKIDILCFPECSVSGYVRDFKKLDFREIEKKIEFLKNLVKKEKINIIVGVPFLEKGKLFNGAAVLLKNGKKFIYHKQHLTKFDQKYFSAGKKNLCFRIGNFKCGVAICRDQSYPQIFKNYKKRGK
jgi:predicted amidohydrolase